MSNQEKEFWKNSLLKFNSSINDAINNLNASSFKIALVIDENNLLIGTISDGDIRRSLLKGLNLKSPISSIVNRTPLKCTPSFGLESILQLMTINKIQQIPIVDQSDRVVGLHLWEKIIAPSARPNTIFIMAGGRGKRLGIHTEKCPKPMLQVGNKPILSHIIERAKNQGFRNFILSINYLGHLVEDYFGNGHSLGVNINYIREGFPLGTAGSLSLLNEENNNPIIVINGDVMTDINLGQLLDYHVSHNSHATMVVRTHEWQNSFGVVQIENNKIVGFEEKPIVRSYINAGIYAINKNVISLLKKNFYCDMPDFFELLSKNNKNILPYPLYEPWIDLGHPEDLVKANENFSS
jgi:dTDP-glucose pyrophosphorylase